MLENNDGLYLNGVWVCSPDGIAATYQANDLSKPDTLECSYTNTFQLPDSLAVRGLTRNAEQLDAGAGLAYQTFAAVVVDNGERTFTGFAELTSFSAGWNVALYDQKTNLFERIDRSIRTADLSRFDHTWDVDGMNKLATATEGACYPVIDYGLLDSGELPLDTIFPAVYAHSIIAKMLAEEGYTLAGTLPADPLYKAITLPFVDTEPTSRDQAFQDDRNARATLDFDNDNFTTNSHKINRIQPYNIVNRPIDGWTQGKLSNFNPITFSYVADTAMRVRVEAFQQFKLRVRSGAFEMIFTLEKNGREVARNYQQYETGHNPFNINVEDIALNELIDCVKGDVLRVRLVAQRRTIIGGFDCEILNHPDNSWFSVTPDLTTATGDVWGVARNLPDLTGLQLIKAIALICEGTYDVDAYRRQLIFRNLTDTVNDTANAVDWSDRVNEAEEPSLTPKIEPYAQKNYLKWKESDDVDKGYGDGVISVAAPNIATEATLFELPFSAAMLSEQTIPAYGNPVKITLRTVTRSTGNVSISQQNSNPRLLLNYPAEAVPVNTRVFDAEGNGTAKAVYLQPCWFGVRPNIAIRPATNFCLAFDSVPGSRAEVPLIRRYYPGLLRVLRRMRSLTLQMYLRPDDIARLDLSKPVRLRRVRVGRLQIADNFFYVNKVGPYRPGQPSAVTLIAFD